MRREDWPERLTEVIERYRHAPFAWGRVDCVTFAADVVFAVTGIDRFAGRRGVYSDQASAELLIGPGGLEAAFRAELGDPIAVARAGRADLLLISIPLGPERALTDVAAVCLGTDVAFTGTHGLLFRPRRDCRIAWRIG